jgi:hypothetical protein
MKRVLEAKNEIEPQKIFFIGGSCSGKTTTAQILADNFGFKHLAIDNYRSLYSDGTIVGENKAYTHFISDVNNFYPTESSCIVESTGLSFRFSELNTDFCYVFLFHCSDISAKFRSVEREMNGYTHPPFPYHLNKVASFENYVEKYPYIEFTYIDTDIYTPIQIAFSIVRLLSEKKKKKITSQKKLFSFLEKKEHYYNDIRL